MNAMINLTHSDIGGTLVQTVNARDLHGFLEVGKDFATWIKDRIAQYGFAEGLDFVTNLAPQNRGARHGGHNSKDYHISLDMAKEVSMVERNEKGKQARQYFIDMERRAKAPAVMLDLSDPDQLIPLLTTYAQRVQVSEAKVKELSPKAAAFDRLDTAEGNLNIRLAAKVLNCPEQKFIKWLELNHWAFRQSGKGPLQSYKTVRDAGYVEHRHNQYHDAASGETKTSVQVVITPKGLAKLAKIVPQMIGEGAKP